MPLHVARRLFYFSRTRLGGRVVGVVFANFAWALPVDVLLGTRHVICFRHPAPMDPSHTLIVPKTVLPTLLALSASSEARTYFADVLHTAGEVAPRLGAPGPVGFTLSCNGGPRQDVRQVHFHLQVGLAPLPAPAGAAPLVLEDAGVEVRLLDDSARGLELELALPGLPADAAQLSAAQRLDAADSLRVLPRLEERFALTRRGFTLRVDERAATPHPGAPFRMRVSAGPVL